MKSILSILISLTVVLPAIAGITNNTARLDLMLPDTTLFNSNTEIPYDTSIEASFVSNVDSLLNIYYINAALETVVDDNDLGMNVDSVPDYPDSIYMQRLSEIPSIIDLSYNRYVKNYINVYGKRRRGQVENMLSLSDYYFPMIEEVFSYYDVPYELKYLAIIESALNPRAVSRAGAVGTWQFMHGTAKIYGLRINSLVDERRDVLKATHSAARFLKNLYGIYGDWTLALAAYNCGPGNVNKAIRRSGGKKDFWDIYYYLPRETRGYVPAFIAATYIMTFPEAHNLNRKEIEIELYTDTITINEKLHLKQVAEVLDVPIKTLRDLNPQYRYDVIPGTKKEEYMLNIPVSKVGAFIELKDSIFAYKDEVFFNSAKLTAAPKAVSSSRNADLPSDRYDKLYYTVKSGDNLGYIADWYDVRISDLRYWNNIRRNIIRSGQKLVVYKPRGKSSRYKKIDVLSFSEKQKFAGRAVKSSSAGISSGEDIGEYTTYTVKRGDSLWEIARKFEGISDSDIARWNNITNNNIRPGQKLKIKKL